MFLNLENYMLPCTNKKLLGFDCLGCGIQRSLVLLFEGNFIAAFKMYPAIYSLIVLVGFVFLNLKFRFNNSQLIIRLLFAMNVILVVGNFILKLM